MLFLENNEIRAVFKAEEMSKPLQMGKLRLCGHAMKRNEKDVDGKLLK